MKKNLTEMVFILDRSGSMGGMETDTVGGFNAMVEKQKKVDGEALVSTVLFNQESTVLHDRVPLDKVAPLTERDYRVGGCTALVDALAGAIKHIANVHRYIREEDRPEKTIFVITTDGLENASHRYSADELKMMVERQKEELGWEFLFLGANIDAVETAKAYGIEKERSVTYRSDKKGTRLNYKAVSEAVCAYRCGSPIAADWAAEVVEHREKAK